MRLRPRRELAPFASLALDGIHREYPNQISHLLLDDGDIRPPRELTPIFFGCFDWHSAVHGHWLLARVAHLQPESPIAERARLALDESFTGERVAGELQYLGQPERSEFERPYGLAWFLQLMTELRTWEGGASHARRLAPLETIVSERLLAWIQRLPYPVRSGEHSQTAFALGLIVDWARESDQIDLLELYTRRSLDFFGADRRGPLNYEPSGHDFLSPCLAEADLLRRVLKPDDFSAWLDNFLPDLGTATVSLAPVSSPDPADGKLSHLDGLNLSRAWMLDGIAAGLPPADPRRNHLLDLSYHHGTLGLHATTGEHYAGGHWLGTFATYWLTGRGLCVSNPAIP